MYIDERGRTMYDLYVIALKYLFCDLQKLF